MFEGSSAQRSASNETNFFACIPSSSASSTASITFTQIGLVRVGCMDCFSGSMMSCRNCASRLELDAISFFCLSARPSFTAG